MEGPDPQEQQPTLPQQPPNFSPFFTLIHDPSTGSTIHPSRVHYLFADDDASDLLTSACIRSLSHPVAVPPTAESPPPSVASSKHLASSTTSSSSSTRRVSRTHKTEKGKSKKASGAAGEREERVLIIDMNETGDGVVSAASLSSEWQVVNAEVCNAPTFGGSEQSGDEDDNEAKKLMLRVEGVGVGAEEGVHIGASGWRRGDREKEGDEGPGEDEMLAIMESFDRKMAILRKIVGQDIGLTAEEVGEGQEPAHSQAPKQSQTQEREEEVRRSGENAIRGEETGEQGTEEVEPKQAAEETES